MSTKILTGYAAIEYGVEHGLTLSMYNSPIEDAHSGLTVEEARDIAFEDGSLIWIAADAIEASLAQDFADDCYAARAVFTAPTASETAKAAGYEWSGRPCPAGYGAHLTDAAWGEEIRMDEEDDSANWLRAVALDADAIAAIGAAIAARN